MADSIPVRARAVDGEVVLAAEAARVLGLLLRGVAIEGTSKYATHADAWARVIEPAAAEAAAGR